MRDAAGNFASDVELELTTVTAGGKARILPVTHTGPGTYEARFPNFKFGEDQQFVWRVRPAASGNPRTGSSQPGSAPAAASSSSPAANGNTAPSGNTASSGEQTVPYGFVAAFPPEFSTLGPDRAVFEQIRARGLAQASSVGSAQSAPSPAIARRWISLWPYLLAVALLLVPLDILVRRIG